MDRAHRRDFLIAAGALLAAPLAAKAQQAAKVARIGWLGDISAAGPRLEAFFQGLHDLGYVQGRRATLPAAMRCRRREREPDVGSDHLWIAPLRNERRIAYGGDRNNE